MSNPLCNLVEDIRDRLTRWMIARWDRALPLNELLLSRDRRASLLEFGEGTTVYDNSYIYGLRNLRVGKKCWIGPNTIIDASGGKLTIGNGVSISCGVNIFTHSAHEYCVSEGKKEFQKAPVEIGDYVFIGTGSVIVPGVKIGHHSIIGAGSIVMKDIPPHSFACGVPAEVKRKNE